MGMRVSGEAQVDMAQMQVWKGGIVKKLTSGVKQLLKANGTKFMKGTARLAKGSSGAHRVIVDGKDGETTIVAKNVVLATGSRPIVIPGFAIDQDKVLDSSGALAQTRCPHEWWSLVVATSALS